MRKARVHAVVAIALSIAAATWFAWGVSWGELGETLARVNLLWVGLASLLLMGEFVIRAVRWRVLLRPLGVPTRVVDLFVATVIGMAVNWRTQKPRLARGAGGLQSVGTGRQIDALDSRCTAR